MTAISTEDGRRTRAIHSVVSALAQFSATRDAFLALQEPSLKALLCSAAVFGSPSPPEGRPRILLLRRAATDAHPLTWELPGGSVDASDACVLSGAVRELREETGLQAESIHAAVRRWSEKDSSPLRTFQETGATWGRLVFLMDAEDTGLVKTRPEEHADWRWVTEQEVRDERFQGEGEGGGFEFLSEDVKIAVLDAFEERRQQKGCQ